MRRSDAFRCGDMRVHEVVELQYETVISRVEDDANLYISTSHQISTVYMYCTIKHVYVSVYYYYILRSLIVGNPAW